jgi:HEAT repeat protein
MAPQSVASLRALPKRHDGNQRQAAAKQLADLGSDAQDAVPELIHALRDRKVQVRFWSCVALGLIGPAAVAAIPELVRIWQKGTERDRIRSQAASALGLIGEAAVPSLLQALNSEQEIMRSKAIDALQHNASALRRALRRNKDQVMPMLIQKLGDPNRDIR